MPDFDAYVKEMKDAFSAMQEAQKKDNKEMLEKAEAAYAQAKASADAAAAAEKKNAEILNRIDTLEASLKQAQMDGVAGAGKALNAYDKAFKAALRQGAAADSFMLDKLAKECYGALMETPNTAGGYLVMPEMAKTIIGTLKHRNVIRELANVVTIGSNEYLCPAWPNGPTMNIAGSDSEDAAAGETPNIVQINIPAVDCDVTVPVTRDILADSAFDLEGFISGQASAAFGNGELNAFTNGGGKNTQIIHGLFGATSADDDTAPAFGTVGYIASGNASGIVSGDAISDLITALPAQFRANAAFMGSRKTISALRKIKKGSDNGYLLWQPSFVAGAPDTLDGYAVYENDFAPAIAAGSIPLVFADFKSAYTIVDRQQMFLLVTINKTSKRVLDYTWFHRVGGAVTDSRAIKYLKIAAE